MKVILRSSTPAVTGCHQAVTAGTFVGAVVVTLTGLPFAVVEGQQRP